MRVFVPLILSLMISGVLYAGCIGNRNTVTPAPTPILPTLTPVPNETIYFTLGDQYLQKNYSFQSEKDIRTEQIRVNTPSWGIEFTVTPLNQNLQYCWFEMNVTNTDTSQTDTYGYGREYGFELNQRYAMYGYGQYKIEMKGNLVKVYVTIAKRNP
jgi:hypothetical protein